MSYTKWGFLDDSIDFKDIREESWNAILNFNYPFYKTDKIQGKVVFFDSRGILIDSKDEMILWKNIEVSDLIEFSDLID